MDGVSEQARPAPAAAVTLPSGPEMRRWIERTRAERAALQERAERVREKFEPIRKELAGIERSIKVLDHFLSQVTVEDAPATATRSSSRRGRPLLPPGQWSRKHDRCLDCGTTERKHKAQGYCTVCYEIQSRNGAQNGVVTPAEVS